MSMIVLIYLGFLVNWLIGAAVCASLDTEDRVWFHWVCADPTPLQIVSFLFVMLWPVSGVCMWLYRRGWRIPS